VSGKVLTFNNTFTEEAMKNSLNMFATRINPTHVKFVFMLVMLAMLVLGAGAPSDTGAVGH
jgi:preprotein translocase subunit SecF